MALLIVISFYFFRLQVAPTPHAASRSSSASTALRFASTSAEISASATTVAESPAAAPLALSPTLASPLHRTAPCPSLQTSVHSWLGIIIVLTTTYCYMNIALKLPTMGGGLAALGGAAAKVGAADRDTPPRSLGAANSSANDEGAKLLDEGDGDDKAATPLARGGRAAS